MALYSNLTFLLTFLLFTLFFILALKQTKKYKLTHQQMNSVSVPGATCSHIDQKTNLWCWINAEIYPLWLKTKQQSAAGLCEWVKVVAEGSV